MTFPITNWPMRINDSFRNEIGDNYHKGNINPLEKLLINMQIDNVHDWLHHALCIIYVGVTKRTN